LRTPASRWGGLCAFKEPAQNGPLCQASRPKIWRVRPLFGGAHPRPLRFETITVMSKVVIIAATFLTCAATLSSKDKTAKVSLREMALGMRDAFNCGLVVEQHLHGRLKDNDEGYRKERDAYNCDHVETVLNSLDDQNGAIQEQ
jgi:hypothetical protein